MALLDVVLQLMITLNWTMCVVAVALVAGSPLSPAIGPRSSRPLRRSSIRATCRITGVAKGTVVRLLVAPGHAATDY